MLWLHELGTLVCGTSLAQNEIKKKIKMEREKNIQRKQTLSFIDVSLSMPKQKIRE